MDVTLDTFQHDKSALKLLLKIDVFPSKGAPMVNVSVFQQFIADLFEL